MSNVSKITVQWSGWSGQPGFSNFWMIGAPTDSEATSAAAAIKALIQTWATYIPQTITLSFQPDLQVFDEQTGLLTDERPIPAKPTDTLGASGLAYAAVSGFCITWRTGVVSVRRPMMGRTFVVPATGAAFATDGTLLDSARTALLASASTYVGRVAGLANGHPAVWRRPSPGGSNGVARSVSSATITDQAVFLRSRRS